MSKDIEAWEGEGGAAHGASGAGPIPMTGTPSQVEWAERIRSRVSDEFDRVAQSFRSVALTQSDANRADTEAILAILEEKRAAVLGRTQAGYFIRDWQEISDQVRQMISRDARHQAIRIKRTTTSPQRETQHGLLKGKNMNLRPLYDRIVVKRTEQQETTRNGIFIPDSAKEKPQEGVVIAVGHGKRLDDGNLVALDVKAGDRILFGKYSGSESKLGGTDYIVMREEDVFGILDGAPNAVPTTG